MFTSLLFSILLVAASVPALPWAQYTDITVPAEPLGQACAGAADRYKLGEDWAVLSTADKDIFLHSTGDAIDFVYFVVGVAGGQIKVVKAVSLEEAKKLYPDPCVWFMETSA